MKTIVITGSTRGIGYGLADAFLASGCSVVISGRKRDAVDLALGKLGSKNPPERICGVPCDTRNLMEVQALWNQAIRKIRQGGYLDQ